MKVLIIGNGAKELALMQSLMEKGGHDVLVVPGNAGVRQFSHMLGSDYEMSDPEDIEQAAKEFNPDYVFVIDEGFARHPIMKTLKDDGFHVFGPEKKAADILYNKCCWSRYCHEHDLKVPDSDIVTTYDDAYNLIQENEGPWVLTKLSDPSEFTVCYLEEEAAETLSRWYAQEEKPNVMISEYFDAPRFYLSAIVNGDDVVPMQSSYIQRGIYEQEDDPETKGMGAFCPADVISPDLRNKAVTDFLIPFFACMQKDGIPYEGFMAGEFVIVDNEPYCVNLKCGLSDCASILTFHRLQDDILKVIPKIEEKEPVSMHWSDKPCASVVLAASDYPNAPSIGKPVVVDEDFEGTFYPHRMKLENGRMATNGGRIAMVLADGETRQEAAAKAVEAASHIQCDDLFYRTDIGQVEG